MDENEIKNIVDNYYIYNGNYNNKNVDKICFFDYGNKIFIKYNDEKISLKKFVDNVDKYEIKLVFFKFNFENKKLNLKEADEVIKNIKEFNKIIKKKNIKVGIEENGKIILGSVLKGNSEYEDFVIYSGCLNIFNSKKQRNEFLYDKICEYLDNKVVSKNICGFENDICVAKRNTNCKMGCCHHYKNKRLGILYQRRLLLCEYQKNKSCTAKCITCKMYMCDYLRKRGYNFTCNNVLLIKHYFNFVQKIIIKTNFFTTKEKILKKLNMFCFK